MHGSAKSRSKETQAQQFINEVYNAIVGQIAKGEIEFARRLLEANLRPLRDQGRLYDTAMLAVKVGQPLLAAELLEDAGNGSALGSAEKSHLYWEAMGLYTDANDLIGASRMKGRLASMGATANRGTNASGIFSSLLGLLRPHR